ncbi:recombinase family protein [Cytobacillus sp. S13-E01]|uniref:recombinase family protein n=1 Tax=Cytobacillus sp. S13-E01 TaxID=3031326 RepID=UPI0023D89B4A|nr:recombinase family protein [Cytobacillus sp. S13-E01]MDF0728965.1 recombinase family protein [Cytobacillus sp. S13-E01]
MERDLFNVQTPTVYDQIKEEVKRVIAAYFRISGSSQSIKLQIEKAKNWAEENGHSWFEEEDCFWSEEIEIFNENVLSANQVGMENRFELMRLLKAIEAGQIKVLIVFARDRLARNYYEYMEIVSLILKNKVKVIILGDTAPFSYNYLTEGVHGIQCQQDGTNIASRIKTVQNLYPDKKFGYINDKVNKRYLINEKYHYSILTFFQEVSNTDTFERLSTLLTEFKSKYKRKSVEDCWKLLRTPFYAGYDSKSRNYFQLTYVNPIISLGLFKKVQDVLDYYETDFIKAIRLNEQEAFFHPSCGICFEKMTHRNGRIGGLTASYYCKNHKSNCIFVQDLNEEIVEVMLMIVNNLSREKIKKLAVFSTNKAIRSLKEKRDQLNEMMRLRRTNFFSRNKSLQRDPVELFNRRNEQIQEQELIQRQIDELNYTKKVLGDIEKIIKQKLFYKIKTDEIYIYLSFFLEDIRISSNSIDFKVYFTEFLEGELHV